MASPATPQQEVEMQKFAESTLKLDYLLISQGLQDNSYQSSHQRPASSPFKKHIFDYSEEALKQSRVSAASYLLYSSIYGAYHYALLQPHSMYFLGCSGLSLFFAVGFLNHKMNITLSIADAKVKANGQTLSIVVYDGRSFDVPIRNIRWNGNVGDKAQVDTVDDEGRMRRFIFDFSKTRPQQLVEKELCMAILHPDVHRVNWKH